MQKLESFTLILIMGLVATSTATANIAEPLQPNSAMKLATITKMYQQDVINQGMDDPVVLQQYGSQELQATMQLERD
ncbi:hypothetical protein [Psychrobacter sp. 72-O-c]|uniref:hypothetical protein n=1 Tax=Psychrobacter sp. 72-O-c TaxID=2774125 RepID=UPI001D0F87F5|nr:hypothetical protein [Psychrobacter sp. 72-O-c]